jgi:hypothetical protein
MPGPLCWLARDHTTRAPNSFGCPVADPWLRLARDGLEEPAGIAAKRSGRLEFVRLRRLADASVPLAVAAEREVLSL